MQPWRALQWPYGSEYSWQQLYIVTRIYPVTPCTKSSLSQVALTCSCKQSFSIVLLATSNILIWQYSVCMLSCQTHGGIGNEFSMGVIKSTSVEGQNWRKERCGTLIVFCWTSSLSSPFHLLYLYHRREEMMFLLLQKVKIGNTWTSSTFYWKQKWIVFKLLFFTSV